MNKFFRMTKKNNKWVLVDPDGNPFFMRGANHYGDGSYMPLNLKELYGGVDEWRKSVKNRHIDWGFNYLPPSIGPSDLDGKELTPVRGANGEISYPNANTKRTAEWSAKDFAKMKYPFTLLLGVPEQNMMISRSGYPDVFSKEFRDAVDKRCREICIPLKDNPELIGYHFTHNPPWDFSSNCFHYWIEKIVIPENSAFDEWVELMKRIYGTASRYNGTYGLPIDNINEIKNNKFPLRGYISKKNANRDKLAFMQRVCEEWYKVYSETIRKYDPNHLLLGDRNTLHLRPLPEYAIHKMSQYIDVLSVNVMGPISYIYNCLEQVTLYWDGPIHLADTGAGVYNGKYPKSAYMCKDINEFEEVYSGMMKQGLIHPQIIGMGWCGYYETPSGRSGLVDSRTDKELTDRINVIKKWNEWIEKEYKLKYGI